METINKVLDELLSLKQSFVNLQQECEESSIMELQCEDVIEKLTEIHEAVNVAVGLEKTIKDFSLSRRIHS